MHSLRAPRCYSSAFAKPTVVRFPLNSETDSTSLRLRPAPSLLLAPPLLTCLPFPAFSSDSHHSTCVLRPLAESTHRRIALTSWRQRLHGLYSGLRLNRPSM